MPAQEPGLRGTDLGVDAFIAPTLFAFQQAREDLAHWTEGLSDEQMWARPYALAPLGFQIGHIGGSVERLTMYLRGEQLTEEQIAAVQKEGTPGATREELLANLDASLSASEKVF